MYVNNIKFRKVMFLHLSVILFTEGGVHGMGCAWQGEHAWRKGLHATHHPRHYEIRSVNARAVRIILECILVFQKFRPIEMKELFTQDLKLTTLVDCTVIKQSGSIAVSGQRGSKDLWTITLFSLQKGAGG